jgi:dihydrofolate synthase/folylpolyglutamate synthase
MTKVEAGRAAPGLYERTLAWLYALEGSAGIDLRLDRVWAAVVALGHPERSAPALHVGGTNGKGSTAAMLAAILAAAGHRVGLYTSPHLVSFRERIVVGGMPITEAEVVEGVARIRDVLGDDCGLTCFEMITLLAWCTFAVRSVDVQVLEVGLGGRLDATNVVVPQAVVITNVGWDHEQYLGSELTAIAGEKAGIVKAGVPVVSGATGEAAAVIAARAADLVSPIEMLGRDFALEPGPEGALSYRSPAGTIAGLGLGLLGVHQQRNAALAVRALEVVPALAPPAAAVRVGLAGVVWRGRLEVVQREPLVVLDGAHNPPSTETLVEEVRRLAAGRPVRVLFGVMRDKAWRSMLQSIGSLATEVVLTRPRQARSCDPAELAAAVTGPVRVHPDPIAAYRELLAASAPHEVVLVTGSLFLVGDVLAALDPALAAEAAREQAALGLAGRA